MTDTRNTYHIGPEGFKIWGGRGELLKHLSPDQYPIMILELAKVLRNESRGKVFEENGKSEQP